LNLSALLIAASGVDYSIPTGGKSAGLVVENLFLIITIVLALTSLLVFGVYVWSKNRRHHHHHHGSSRRNASSPPKPAVVATGASLADEAADSTPEEPGEHRHRRRKRKHNHRPRNPTLAETGGLPPLRQSDPPEPQL
jgi:hypothetical protein